MQPTVVHTLGEASQNHSSLNTETYLENLKNTLQLACLSMQHYDQGNIMNNIQ